MKKNELPKDVSEFVDTFMKKLETKRMIDCRLIDTVRDMLTHKLIKENWKKGTLIQ